MQPAVVETEGVVVVAQTPALLVNHLRKTAGSSLERFVRENIARSAIEVELDGPRISKHGDPAETVRAYRDWYRALPAEQRERFRCLSGRTAGYLLPSLDRPAETLVLVREPVDRVLSCHFDFKRRRPKSSQPIAALAET